MINPLNGYVVSIHTQKVLQRSDRQKIKPEWIQRTIDNPSYSDRDERTNAVRAWKRIPEYGDRALNGLLISLSVSLRLQIPRTNKIQFLVTY
ncbi:hypothetical protein NIES970_30040 (plasmid) [[Synechococcus] sp. NIES-970]|nr:hypothetical protein NIES970_30040 [[Synechococcus] sp. NIES-970]